MRVTTRRRFVETKLAKSKRGKLWAYGYADLAVAMGLTQGTLRNKVSSGEFDPGDLVQVARAIVRSTGGL